MFLHATNTYDTSMTTMLKRFTIFLTYTLKGDINTTYQVS